MIIILPGTKWSEELCKKIKKMNKEIILVSPEEHPFCEKYSDEFYKSDIYDIEGIVEYSKSKNIEAVISDECDIAMPVVAELGKRLGVKTLSVDIARLYTDKYRMREFSKRHGFAYPEYCLCKTKEDVLRFYHSIGKDIIIKPIDSNASHGVFRISSDQDIEKHFENSIGFSHIRREVIAERYINGTEFTIDGIKTPSNHYTLCISRKKHFEYNENIAYELFFSHHSNEFDYDNLRKINDDFVNQSGLEFGLTHAEYKFENGQFYLIEIAARGGGNQISSLIAKFMSGYDTYEYLVNCALGRVENMNFDISKNVENNVAVLHFFSVPGKGGRVARIHGEDFLKNSPAILDYELRFDIGDHIYNAGNDSDRIGYYIAVEKNEQALRRIQMIIDKEFFIELE